MEPIQSRQTIINHENIENIDKVLYSIDRSFIKAFRDLERIRKKGFSTENIMASLNKAESFMRQSTQSLREYDFMTLNRYHDKVIEARNDIYRIFSAMSDIFVNP